MLAARRDDVDDLNTRARLLMRESAGSGKLNSWSRDDRSRSGIGS